MFQTRTQHRGRQLLTGRAGLGALALVGVVACGPGDSGPPVEKTEAEIAAAAARAAQREAKELAKVRAKEIFAERCTDCHGSNGAGNGPQSDDLSPRPRNFQDPDWQKGATDEYLAQIIVLGGEAVGRAAIMPGNPDLEGDERTVDALVAYIRSLAFH